MSKKQDHHIVVGLDIGTSKICTVVAEVASTGIEIIGIGQHPCRGLKKGVVVNIDATVGAIQKSVEEAELMAGVQVQSVYAGIAGSHIRGFNSNGIVAINKQREVTMEDVARVIDAARAIAIPEDQKILHILPQEFIIDDQAGVREPVGMSGVRLEARVHIVTGAVGAAQNIVKCVNRCQLNAADIVLEQIASSEAVLGSDEKELGVCVVDIGGGTTDIAVFIEGAIRHTAVIPIAGDQVTNDIAVFLRTPMQAAEDIKRNHGSALTTLPNREETIDVPTAGDRPPRSMSRQTLAEIIEPRVAELFQLVQAELQREGLHDMISSGIVITGGSSNMPGMVDLAEEIFHMPVRLGEPINISGLNDLIRKPQFATGVGLVLYAYNNITKYGPEVRALDSSQESIFHKMKSWFKNTF